MKKVFIVALLFTVLIFAFCSIGAAAIKNHPDGFGGVKWGDPPSKLGARDKIESDGIMTTYKKKNEKMVFGAVNVKEIAYQFIQDRELFSVLITVEGSHNSRKFRDTLIARYGEPNSRETKTEYYWWDEEVSINYTYYALEEQSKVQIYSEIMYNKLAAILERERRR